MNMAPLILGGGAALLGFVMALTIGGMFGGICLITGIGVLAVGVITMGMGTRGPANQGRGRDW